MRVRVNVMLAAVKERVNVEDEYDAGSESKSE
jgi:hypothetical protein